MNLKTLFSAQYLFQINSAFVSPGEKLFAFAGGILVLLAIATKIAAVLAPAPVDKKYRNKFYHLFLTIGLLELLWYLCRFENVMFFGTNFVAWVLALGGLVWLTFVIIDVVKNYGKEKENWDKEMVRQKYLPNWVYEVRKGTNVRIEYSALVPCS